MKLLQIYQCLCDETRLRILNLLTRGPLCVCHLQSVLGLGQVAVSKHLAYLRNREMVVAERHGQWMVYRLPEKPSKTLTRHLQCLQDCALNEPVFKADARRLQTAQRDCAWDDLLGSKTKPRAKTVKSVPRKQFQPQNA